MKICKYIYIHIICVIWEGEGARPGAWGGARRGARGSALGHRRRRRGAPGDGAPTDYTKPRQTIQSPDRPYKDPNILDKTQKY